MSLGGGRNSSSAGTGSGVTPGRDSGPASAKGCGCRVGGDTDASSSKLAWFSALLGLGLALQRRRGARVDHV